MNKRLMTKYEATITGLEREKIEPAEAAVLVSVISICFGSRSSVPLLAGSRFKGFRSPNRHSHAALGATSMLSSAAHFLLNLALHGLFFLGFAFVVQFAAATKAEQQLGAPAFEVHFQRHER